LNHLLNLSPLSFFWRRSVKGVTIFNRLSYRHSFPPPFISNGGDAFLICEQGNQSPLTGRSGLASTHLSLDGKRHPRQPNLPPPIPSPSYLGPFLSGQLYTPRTILDLNRKSRLDIAFYWGSTDQ
jgi:hypothetical protein